LNIRYFQGSEEHGYKDFSDEVVILDLGDAGKGYFDDLPIRAEDFDAGSGEGLCVLHAANFPADPLSVYRNDFDVVFAVKRLQSRQCLGYFHSSRPPCGSAENRPPASILPFTEREVYRVQPEKIIWRIENSGILA
jgi:hypothetical protein